MLRSLMSKRYVSQPSHPMPYRKLRCKHCGAAPTEGLFDHRDDAKDISGVPWYQVTYACGRTIERNPDYPGPFETTPCPEER